MAAKCLAFATEVYGNYCRLALVILLHKQLEIRFMEHVTDISVPVQGKEVTYRVLFHDELYTFEPANDAAPSFSLRREHNQWQCTDGESNEVTKHAIARLEKFLLSQH